MRANTASVSICWEAAAAWLYAEQAGRVLKESWQPRRRAWTHLQEALPAWSGYRSLCNLYVWRSHTHAGRIISHHYRAEARENPRSLSPRTLIFSSSLISAAVSVPSSLIAVMLIPYALAGCRCVRVLSAQSASSQALDKAGTAH